MQTTASRLRELTLLLSQFVAMEFRWAISIVTVLALCAMACVGCGPSSDKLGVSGVVTLDGVPLDRGSMRLSSVGETLSSSGCSIREGAFQIPAEKGLSPGTYRVQINSADLNAAPVLIRSGPGDPGVRTQPERIPAEYSVDGKHTVEVSADSENHFEFAIVTSK
jgi:hypothetical protein